MPDHVELEMRLAELMAQQEASGFRFDLDAAETVKARLQKEAEEIELQIKQTYLYCLLYTSPSPRDRQKSRMPSSA